MDFNKYIVSAFCVPGTAPGARDREWSRCAAIGLMVSCLVPARGTSALNSLILPSVDTYERCTRVNREVKWVSVCMGVSSEYRKEGGAILYGLRHQWYLGWKLPVPLSF